MTSPQMDSMPIPVRGHQWRMATVLVGCLAMLFLVTCLFAPIWHDEALILLEFSGHREWPAGIVSAGTLQSAMHERTSFAQLFSDMARLNYDIHPPLYYVLLWCWRGLAGSSLFSLRLFSAVIWLAFLVVFWKWSKSTIAVALCTLSYVGITFATMGRNYALACFWIVLAAYLWDPKHHPSNAALIFGSIAGGLAVWTHYFALFPVAAMILFHAADTWRTEPRRALLAMSISALVAAPVSYFVISQKRPPTPALFPGVVHEGYLVFRNLLRMPLAPSLTAGRAIDAAASVLFLFPLLAVPVTWRRRSVNVRSSFCLVISFSVLMVLSSFFLKAELGAIRYLGLVAPLLIC